MVLSQMGIHRTKSAPYRVSCWLCKLRRIYSEAKCTSPTIVPGWHRAKDTNMRHKWSTYTMLSWTTEYPWTPARNYGKGGGVNPATVDANHNAMAWKHFRHYWPFVKGIYQWPMDSPHKWSVMCSIDVSLLLAWTKRWKNSRSCPWS